MTIWNNQDIKIDNRTISFRNWFDKGVHTVKDRVDQNLDFVTYEEFQLRYHLETIFFDLLWTNKRYSTRI